MATTSLWPIHNTGGRGVRKILNKLVEYAENGEKTKEGSGEGNPGRSNPEIMQSVMGYAARSDKVSSGKETVQAMPSEEESKEEMKQVFGILSDQGEGVRYVTGVNCSPERAVDEMMITKNRWPDHGNRLLYHGYQSFTPGEVILLIPTIRRGHPQWAGHLLRSGQHFLLECPCSTCPL